MNNLDSIPIFSNSVANGYGTVINGNASSLQGNEEPNGLPIDGDILCKNVCIYIT